jgi:alkylated DNA repair dioxygenase AlkB
MSASAAALAAAGTARALMSVPGLRLVEDIVSAEGERILLDFVNSSPWNNTLKRRTQHYGYEYDYTSGTSLRETTAVPELFKYDLCSRFSFPQQQCIVNEYVPGQGIGAHIDSPSLFGDTVVSVSLGSHCIMTFSRTDLDAGTKKEVDIVLPRRSAVILQGEARYEWSHSIAPRKSDIVAGVKVQRQTRVSLTFRDVKKPRRL